MFREKPRPCDSVARRRSGLAAACRAQQVSLKLGEGNLDQAFQQIIRQSNVQLVYDTDRAAGIRCRACSFTNREVGDVIAALLEGTGLTCTYRDGSTSSA